MKKTMKWIFILAAATMLTMLAGSAMADDRIYTSPSFRLPGNRIETSTEEYAAEGTEAEGDVLTAEAAEEPEEAAAEPEAAEEPEEAAVETEAAEEPEEAAVETEAAEEPEEAAAETETAEEPAAEAAGAGEPAADETGENAEPAGEPDETDELAVSADAWDTAPEGETVPEERQVLVRSSRRDTVTGGEVIELTSRLVGFGEAEVHYQWQVDRNDGAGWVDAEDGNRWKYTFLADRTTVMYNWRLIVTVDE